jgi:hypothetical protein
MDANGLADPYVKVYLTPASPVMQTDVQHKTLFPIFKEQFRLYVLRLLEGKGLDA